MSIFTKAATSALTGLAIFGFASAAFAHHNPQQPFVKEESIALLNAVSATGHRISVDGAICTKHGGGLMGAATTERVLHICEKNHRGDLDELADTIRHEALHLAQMCKGRKNGTRISLLVPQEAERIRHDARVHLHFTGAHYRPDQMAVESEARVLAHIFEESQVAQILHTHCGS